jgi:uncharacterized membrane protein YphA (DoxX/SURF4 family)
MKTKVMIVETSRCLLIILFIYASLIKILDYKTFQYQLRQSPYLTQYANLVSWIIPGLELLASFLLVINRTKLAGFLLSFFLMSIFTGYIYSMLHFSSYISCSCGGVLSGMSWDQHFLFNILFSMISVVGFLLTGRTNDLDNVTLVRSS